MVYYFIYCDFFFSSGTLTTHPLELRTSYIWYQRSKKMYKNNEITLEQNIFHHVER